LFLQGNLKGFQHLGIPVTSINKTVFWYTDVLNFKDIHRAVIPTDSGEIIIHFLQLGNLVLEFYQLIGEELGQIKNRSDGYINHLAIEVLDIDKAFYYLQSKVSEENIEGPHLLENVWLEGVKYINIKGPDDEIIELNQRLSLNSARRSENILNLSHVGMPTLNIEKTKEFYKRFGFETVVEAEESSADKLTKIVMLEKEGLILEYYGLLDNADIPTEDGHIDHIALDVADIGRAFTELKTTGFKILEEEPVYLPCWERGVKYFNVLGPNNERIEFNQKL